MNIPKLEIPQFDLPQDFVIGDNITSEILSLYKHFPCKILAGVFVICVRGTIKASVNLSEFEIVANDMVALSPESFLQIHEISDDTLLYFAAFSSKAVREIEFLQSSLGFFNLVYNNPVIPIGEDMCKIYCEAFTLIIHAKATVPDLLTTDMTTQITSIFIRGISNMYAKEYKAKQITPSKDYQISQDFLQKVMKNYTREHSVTYYAKELNISLTKLCSIIKQQTERTALEIINSMIIMDAKAQLKVSHVSVKDLAFTLGFNNPAFFNKFFKKHTGFTPIEYRNKRN